MSGVDLDNLEQVYRINEIQQLPITELRELYKKAIDDLMEEKIKYEEYELTSKEYEQELENMNDQNQKRVDELEHENEQYQKELDKIRNKYDDDKKEMIKLEKENEILKKSLGSTGDQAKIHFQRLRNLEIDNEQYERQLRISEQIIQDLEQKLDSSLEELALLQSELEEYKLHSQEQLERLKQQLEETNTELQVKERELKKIKIQQLMFEANTMQSQQHSGVQQNQQQQNTSFNNSKTLNAQYNHRLSQGKNGNNFSKMNTQDVASRNFNNHNQTNSGNKDHRPNTQYQTLNTQNNFDEEGTDIFERADYDMTKRPESARYQAQGRSSLLSNSNNRHLQEHAAALVNYEQTPVQEEENSSSRNDSQSNHDDQNLLSQTQSLSQIQLQGIDQEEKQENSQVDEEQEENFKRLERQDQSINNQIQDQDEDDQMQEEIQDEEQELQVEHVEEDQLFSQANSQIQTEEIQPLTRRSNLAPPPIEAHYVGRKSNTFIEQSKQMQTQQVYNQPQIQVYNQMPLQQQNHYQQPNPKFLNNQSQSYGQTFNMINYNNLNLQTHPEFDENLLMDDLNIDELLECDDIEQTAFINQSRYLISAFDSMISSIDDRINSKRQNFYGAGATGYYGGNNFAPNGPSGHDDFGMGSFSHKNTNFMGANSGYHQNQNLHHNEKANMMGGLNRGSMAADNFDKTRKISVLY
eukprot:403336069